MENPKEATKTDVEAKSVVENNSNSNPAQGEVLDLSQLETYRIWVGFVNSVQISLSPKIEELLRHEAGARGEIDYIKKLHMIRMEQYSAATMKKEQILSNIRSYLQPLLMGGIGNVPNAIGAIPAASTGSDGLTSFGEMSQTDNFGK